MLISNVILVNHWSSKAKDKIMADKIFVITADDVNQTKEINFKFIFDSGIKIEDHPLVQRVWSAYGFAHLRPHGRDEIRISDFHPTPENTLTTEQRANLHHWKIDVGGSAKHIFGCNVEAVPHKEYEEGLISLLGTDDFPNCILLMPRKHFNRFEQACQQISGLELGHFHYSGILATSA
jgi:hypothetical protein